MIQQVGPITYYPCKNCGRIWPAHVGDTSASSQCPGFAPNIPPPAPTADERSASALERIAAALEMLVAATSSRLVEGGET